MKKRSECPASYEIRHDHGKQDSRKDSRDQRRRAKHASCRRVLRIHHSGSEILLYCKILGHSLITLHCKEYSLM